eukprot:2137663-Rhodomonas_salina.1
MPYELLPTSHAPHLSEELLARRVLLEVGGRRDGDVVREGIVFEPPLSHLVKDFQRLFVLASQRKDAHQVVGSACRDL